MDSEEQKEGTVEDTKPEGQEEEQTESEGVDEEAAA